MMAEKSNEDEGRALIDLALALYAAGRPGKSLSA
jgi:hypothetical protein